MCKILGVLIDSSLDWSSHVQYIKSKLVGACYLTYKFRNVVSADVSKMVYFSLLHCLLKCCIVSWGTASNSVLQPPEVVHKNFLRTLTYNNFRCSGDSSVQKVGGQTGANQNCGGAILKPLTIRQFVAFMALLWFCTKFNNVFFHLY